MIFNRHGLPPGTFMAIYQWNGPTASPTVRIKPKRRQHPLKAEARVVFVYPDGSVAPYVSVPMWVGTVWETDPPQDTVGVGNTRYRGRPLLGTPPVVPDPVGAMREIVATTEARFYRDVLPQLVKDATTPCVIGRPFGTPPPTVPEDAPDTARISRKPFRAKCVHSCDPGVVFPCAHCRVV